MRNILRWLLGLKSNASGITATSRMKMMLVNDRYQLPPAIVEQLKQDFLSVASRYFDIDSESSECVIKSLGDRKAFISATVPLLGRGLPNDEQHKSNHQTRNKSSRRNNSNLSSTAS